MLELSSKYEKSAAQILLRWSIQHGFVVICRSEKVEHIMENAQVFSFEISTEDMSKLDKLNKGYRTMKAWVSNQWD